MPPSPSPCRPRWSSDVTHQSRGGGARQPDLLHAVSGGRGANGLSHPLRLHSTNAAKIQKIMGERCQIKNAFRGKVSSAWGPRSVWVRRRFHSCPPAGGGGNSAESGGPPKASDVIEGGPKVAKGQTIAKESEVKPNSAFPFTNTDTGQQSVLVHLEDGEFMAYSAVCTHQACTVAYKDGQLACPCHGSVFDPSKGAAVLNGPANRPLPQVAIRVEGGEITRA